MSNENTTDTEEVKNPDAVLKKNSELIARIKSLQTELESAKTALQVAQDEAQKWRAQWHQVAIIDPFDLELDSASAGPAKYLRQELLERGIIRMDVDEDGIERPTWYNLEGIRQQPADVWKFLSDIKDPAIDRMIRSSGASGSGATRSAPESALPQQLDKPKETEKPSQFGLR